MKIKSLKVKIGQKFISDEHPVFIIAEIGVNHNGSLKMAKRLIDVASKARVDAVKFQTFNPETLVTKSAAKASYQIKNDGRINETQYEMLKRLMLPRQFHRELKIYAEKKGLIFLSTPFSLDDARYLRKLGVQAIKVGSSDTDNTPYLSQIATWELPIILSTGMSDLKEIKNSVRVIQRAGCRELVILHCTTNYPCPAEEANLNAIKTLKRNLGLLVGFSDHTSGIEASMIAVALGARVIEKHITLDKNLPGPDHKASLDPHELTFMVSSIRKAERLLGSGIKQPLASEQNIAKLARKSLVAAVPLSVGVALKEEYITIKRPGTGIPPKFLAKVVGKKLKFEVKKDQPLTWEVIKR